MSGSPLRQCWTRPAVAVSSCCSVLLSFRNEVHPRGLSHLPEGSAQRAPSFLIAGPPSAASGEACPQHVLCSELGESQWLGFLGPGCSVIFLLQVYFHHQLVLDKKIQDRTGGREEASRRLASSVAPCISEQHTPEIVIFSAPLLFVCFSSPNLKRGFCMHPDNHLVNR